MYFVLQVVIAFITFIRSSTSESAQCVDSVYVCCTNYFEVNGTCKECPAGTMGPNCSIPCPPGYHGRLCLWDCDCSKDQYCDPVSGCKQTTVRIWRHVVTANDSTTTHIRHLPAAYHMDNMTPWTVQGDLRVIRSDVAFSSIGFLLVLIAAVGIIFYKSSWRISRDGTHLLRFQLARKKSGEKEHGGIGADQTHLASADFNSRTVIEGCHPV
ncbi:uncharacterized protein LOC128190423 [Crassostrea angulata]|uniref:uncharacterized protein LOC128190423 n=1 Tax=Magallana angulata TaxID=2784310 RepID=UPI0022B12958|nr:uncharacterized protein LOC128190423 [Crassostrea angulata]